MKSWVVRGVITAIVMAVLQILVGAFFLRGVPAVPGVFAWSQLSNGIVALVVCYLASRCGGSRRRRAALSFLVLFGIPADYLAEAFYFDIGLPTPMLLRLYLSELLVALAVSALVAWRTPAAPVAANEPPVAPPAAATGPLPRLGIAALSYVVGYFAAGLAVFPFVASFYAGRAMPGVGQVAIIQLFRGLGYALIAYAIVRSTAARRWEKILAVGLTLSLVGGVAPLIVPSAYLPAAVRLAHLVETGLSNFVFGAFAAWLFTRPSAVGGRERVAPLVVS